MAQNHLKMNDGKTEFIFGSAIHLSKYSTESLNVKRCIIPKSEVVKHLGAWFNANLNFKTHITQKCCTLMLNIQQIRIIRPFLDQKATEKLMLGLVVFHPYYCTNILVDLQEASIKYMQNV